MSTYADGTGGWSGSDTSRERAEREATDGTLGARQRQVLGLVLGQGFHGATCQELQNVTGKGHGAISGALSNLHKAGHLVRLTQRRGRQQVYVHPDRALDRPQAPYRSNKPGRAHLRMSEITMLADDLHHLSIHSPGVMEQRIVEFLELECGAIIDRSQQ